MPAVQRRPIEEPPQPQRTPERERVARVVQEHNAGLERLARQRKALAETRADSTAALQAVDEAERAVERAAREEPARASAELIGESFEGSGLSLEVAETRLLKAKARHQH